MGRSFNVVGAILSGVVIVASYIYVDRQSDAVLMLAPFILAVFALEIAVFLYFVVAALWKRKPSGASGDK